MNWIDLNNKWEDKIKQINISIDQYCTVELKDGTIYKGNLPEEIDRKIAYKYGKLDRIKENAQKIADSIKVEDK